MPGAAEIFYPESEPETPKIFQVPLFSFAAFHKTGTDMRPLAIGRPLADLIRIRNKEKSDQIKKIEIS